jgi:hypothetical protein
VIYEKGEFMYYLKRHSVLEGLIFLIFGFAIIIGVLLWLDLNRPWQWPMLFGIVWSLIIASGPILIIAGIRLMILGYLERMHFPIPPQHAIPRMPPSAPVQLKLRIRDCPHCRKQIPLDSRFCAYCSAEV